MAVKKKEDLPHVEIGILGGTEFYEIEGIEQIEEIQIETPFGKTSDNFIIGTLEGKRVAFLSRHGRGHQILPSEINYRANIYGFKKLGVERIISVSAAGSLKEEIKPGDIVFNDQFFDRTRRNSSFFCEGIAVHISFAQPVCAELSTVLYEAGKELGLRVHQGGTYICIEGPAFSTKAESRIYRSWDCDVIGMTSATEAKLCREAEICYSNMNLVSDYDVWHEVEEPVSVKIILENLRRNIHNAKAIIKKTVTALPPKRSGQCDCAEALKDCIVTQSDVIPEEIKEKLQVIFAKYVK
ncbi:MAG: S-methyl-5'-thioadenosine phosphorylase [Candidatus Aminicenantes bacterium]|nr:S-methyl-5'-thioadenosine phosphorylase [Candidatus Aminicenantes bacterium]